MTSSAAAIVPYDGSPRHRCAFRDINVAWISLLFSMEAPDYTILDDPESTVLAPGGRIWIAEVGGLCVGTVALLAEPTTANRDCDRYELAKMGVLQEYRGRGIGKALARCALSWAYLSGANTVFLLGNGSLSASIAVYKACGFSERPLTCEERSLYQRVTFAMEVGLRPMQVRMGSDLLDSGRGGQVVASS